MIVVCIAGGSGSGESTVSYHLVDTYPERFQIQNLTAGNTIVGNEGYVEKVLASMFRKYVEPTKNHAGEIIDVSSMEVDEIASQIFSTLKDLEV